MNHRLVTLLPLTAALAAAGKITIDLDMTDPISQILIEQRVLSGVGASTTDHPWKVMTKVEIVDGSDVLWSLNGCEADALDHYDTGKHPRSGEFFACNNMDINQVIALNFGRVLWDETLAFDPSKFANPQLTITHNYALGGLAPVSCQYVVSVMCFDEKPISPTGWLMAKEIKSYACTDLAHEYTELPTDYPIRKLMVGSRYAGEDPGTIVTNLKLSSDQDKKVIFDDSFRNLIQSIGAKNSRVEDYVLIASAAAARYCHVCPTRMGHAVINPNDGAATAGDCDASNVAGGYLTHYSAAAGNTNCRVEGIAPHGFLCIPFGKQDVIEDWFDVSSINSLKLDTTSGSTTPTVEVVLQQLRSY